MPITYGMNLAKSWGRVRRSGTVLMKAYTTHTEESEVFVPYQHSDQFTALELAKDLDQKGRRVFIDVHDDTLVPGQKDLDEALLTAIRKSDTMIVVVQALELLGEASALRDESGLVFPSPLKPGAPMPDMTLTKLLRSTGLSERATVHGFRSSFKNWTLEQTDAPWAVSEAALAHILGNSTEQAYARSDLFERRRALMQQWADYLTG